MAVAPLFLLLFSLLQFDVQPLNNKLRLARQEIARVEVAWGYINQPANMARSSTSPSDGIQSSMVEPLCSVRSNLPFARDISDRADESPGGQDAFAVDDPLRLTVQAYSSRGEDGQSGEEQRVTTIEQTNTLNLKNNTRNNRHGCLLWSTNVQTSTGVRLG